MNSPVEKTEPVILIATNVLNEIIQLSELWDPPESDKKNLALLSKVLSEVSELARSALCRPHTQINKLEPSPLYSASTVEALKAERDAAFAMSKCECGPDEACANLASLSTQLEALKAENAALLSRVERMEKAQSARARLSDLVSWLRESEENGPLLIASLSHDEFERFRSALQETKP